MNNIILASGSEGRRELFNQEFGDHFIVYTSGISEEGLEDLQAQEIVTQLAQRKSLTAIKKFPNDFIFAFDTIVVCENKILGKPSTITEAQEMLNFLNNKKQFVWTGYAFYYQDAHYYGAVSSELILTISNQEIQEYISKYPVTLFAGAYAVQKEDTNITMISGSMDIVIGAPMNLVKEFLNQNKNPTLNP
ncbi:MAG: Maf family protein [Brevinema sp.]